MIKDIVKFIPFGGQAENGKNMYCIEINNKIIIIDSGFRFPDSDKLGVDIIIPSFTYLEERKDQVVAIIITHGHDDTMGALPYLLQSIQAPVYAPSLTGDLIEQLIDRHQRQNKVEINLDLRRVKRNASINIEGIPVEFFPMTHSIPGTVGVALWTTYGYIVYCSEFIIDFGAPTYFKSDIQKMMEIGKKGVLALLVESVNAKNAGYTSPKHKLKRSIDSIFEESNERIIISTYAQNIFRIKEIIELVEKYNRKIVFYGRDEYDDTNSLIRIGKTQEKPVLYVPERIKGDKSKIGDYRYDSNYVVVLTGTPRRIYHDICDIIDGGDDLLKLRKGDTFIIASPVLPGTEKIANKAHNSLFKTDAFIHMIKTRNLFSMHASEEDIKVIIQTFNPKYYIPIKGEYQHMIANSHIAKEMGIYDDDIVIVDNGEIITFEDGFMEYNRDFYHIEEVMVDGIGIGDVGEKVIDDRIQLSNDGVVVVGITVNKETHDIICQTDCQTRGFVYLKDAEHIIKHVIEICEETIEFWKQNNQYDVLDIRQMMKDKCSKYIYKETGKKPVFISVVVEI